MSAGLTASHPSSSRQSSEAIGPQTLPPPAPFTPRKLKTVRSLAQLPFRQQWNVAAALRRGWIVAQAAGQGSGGSRPSSLQHISHILPVVYPSPVEQQQQKGARVRDMTQIFFATGNPNKLRETVAILDAGHQLPFTIKSVNIDLPELQGEAVDIAKEKCRIAATKVGAAVMVEDTSLCFNAYHGLPGPYIKWFLTKVGHEGLNRMLAGYEDKSAYAQCIFAFTPGPGIEPVAFVGRTPGRIVPARGETVFGWDPIFQPEGFDLTYSEMDKATKNTISHRFRALTKLREYLTKTLPAMVDG